jgi:excisionase family DNA binding protein
MSQTPATSVTAATPERLSTRQVAEQFDVSASTVTRWVRLGYLPAGRFPGKRGRLAFDPADVATLAARLSPEKASA